MTTKELAAKAPVMTATGIPNQAREPFRFETKPQLVRARLSVAPKCPGATHESLASHNANIGFLRHIGLLLDEWSVRGYSHDTHMWSAKMEVLRSLKSCGCHTRQASSATAPRA